jgi:hypothetical protein
MDFLIEMASLHGSGFQQNLKAESAPVTTLRGQ